MPQPILHKAETTKKIEDSMDDNQISDLIRDYLQKRDIEH